MKGFNRHSVAEFVDSLESLIAKHDLDAERMYNMDETMFYITMCLDSWSADTTQAIRRQMKRKVGLERSHSSLDLVFS